MKKLFTFIAIAIWLSLSPFQTALASSCNKVITSKIKFSKGASCWKYEGTNNSYVGKFNANQRISVSMFGLAAFANEENGTDKKWQPRSPSVSGPDGFFEMDIEGDGKMEFVTPRAGTYTFDFGPCAMWGGYGEVEICAR